MQFKDDQYKNDRLMLVDKLTKKMKNQQVNYSGELFHNVLYVYTESQQWSDVANILKE